jgi:hypothetical protein
MRLEWIYGLGAMSTLAVLVGVDLLLALLEQKGVAVSYAVVRGLRQGRSRRD